MGRWLLDDDFIARIEQLELVSRRIVSGKLKGERRSRRRGHSSEFADFRPYVEGDDLRFLDWNIYARFERFFLKLFLEEEDLWLTIIIDASSSMRFGDPEKLEYAKKIAAAMGYIGLINHDRVRVAAFTTRLSMVFGPARGRRQTRPLFEAMESFAVEEGGTDLSQSLRELALRGAKSGIVLLLSDLFDRSGVESALRPLLAAGGAAEVFVFHLLSPQEIEPDLAGDLRLVDVEDGIEAEVSIGRPLLKAYGRTLQRFRDEAKEYCSRRGMHYLFCSTALPFERLVLGYLRQRGLLR
jgi:uncharacterized protein (DUF58 family)